MLNKSIWNLVAGMRALFCEQMNKVFKILLFLYKMYEPETGHFCP